MFVLLRVFGVCLASASAFRFSMLHLATGTANQLANNTKTKFRTSVSGGPLLDLLTFRLTKIDNVQCSRFAGTVAQHVSPNTPGLCDMHTGRTIFDIALRELPLQKSRCCMPRLSGSELSTVRVRFPLLRVALAHLHLRTHEHECEIMSSEVFLCMLVLLRVFGVPVLAGELGCNHWCLTASPRTCTRTHTHTHTSTNPESQFPSSVVPGSGQGGLVAWQSAEFMHPIGHSGFLGDSHTTIHTTITQQSHNNPHNNPHNNSFPLGFLMHP